MVCFEERMDALEEYRNVLASMHDSTCGLCDKIDAFMKDNLLFSCLSMEGNRYRIQLRSRATIEKVEQSLQMLIDDNSPFSPFGNLIYKIKKVPCQENEFFITIKRKVG